MRKMFEEFKRVQESLSKASQTTQLNVQQTFAKVNAVHEQAATAESKINAKIQGMESKIDAVDNKIDARIDNIETKIDARIDNIETKIEQQAERLNKCVHCPFEIGILPTSFCLIPVYMAGWAVFSKTSWSHCRLSSVPVRSANH